MHARAIFAAMLALIASGCGKGVTYRSSCSDFCKAFKGSEPFGLYSVNQTVGWKESITIEMRFRLDAAPPGTAYLLYAPMGLNLSYLSIEIDSASQLSFNASNSPTCSGSTSGTGIITLPLNLGQNYHLAVAVTEGVSENMDVYLDGVRIKSISGPSSGSFTTCGNTSAFYVGNQASGISGVSGVFDDLRISIGPAPRYSGPSYTVPRGPLPIDSMTTLLLNFDSVLEPGASIANANPTAFFNSFSGSYVTSPF